MLVCVFAKLVGRQHVARWATEVAGSAMVAQVSSCVELHNGNGARVVQACAGHEVLERGFAAAERSLSLYRWRGIASVAAVRCWLQPVRRRRRQVAGWVFVARLDQAGKSWCIGAVW